MTAKDTTRTLSITLLAVVMLFVSIAPASAISVGLGGNQEVYPGQVITGVFNIGNFGDGATNAQVQVILENGEEIVTLLDDGILLAPADAVSPSRVRIEIPETAQVGDEYTITVFAQVLETEAADGDGNVAFVSDGRNSITLTVVEVPQEVLDAQQQAAEQEVAATSDEGGSGIGGSGIGLMIVALLVIGVVIAVVVMRKKSSSAPASDAVSTAPAMTPTESTDMSASPQPSA